MNRAKMYFLIYIPIIQIEDAIVKYNNRIFHMMNMN